MSDVLTKEDEASIARVNRDLCRTDISRTSRAWRKRLLSIIDRLVSEVERLRERNEKLERVRDAAWNFRAVVGRGPVPSREWDELDAALAACEESKP